MNVISKNSLIIYHYNNPRVQSYDQVLDVIGMKSYNYDSQYEIGNLIIKKLTNGGTFEVYGVPSESRVALAKRVRNFGFKVYYVINDDKTRNSLLGGDGLAELVDERTGIEKISDLTIFDSIKKKSGLTVIPDIHGDMSSMNSAIKWAKARNKHILFLGDLIDHGYESKEVIDEVYKMVINGEADVIMGNHERKILTYIELKKKGRENEITLSEGNMKTIHQLEQMGKYDRHRWENRFKSLCKQSRHCLHIGEYFFSHAAFDAAMLDSSNYYDYDAGILNSYYEKIAVIGLYDSSKARDSSWVNHVPSDMTVVVGHEIMSKLDPVVMKKNGTIIFLDTGCGKKGHLSTLDFSNTGNCVKMENFNLH